MEKVNLSKIKLWNLMTQEMRREIRDQYKIKPTGSKEIVDNKIVRDGVQENDLAGVPKEAILDKLNIKIHEEENTEQDNEETVQHSNRGGRSSNKSKKK